MRSAFTEAVRQATEQRAGHMLSDLEGSEAGVGSVAQLFKAEISRVANATGSDVSCESSVRRRSRVVAHRRVKPGAKLVAGVVS